MPVIVAILVPQPGKIDELAEALAGIISDVHQEPGCELYALHRNADKVVMVEKWHDAEAVALHEKSPSLAKLGAQLGDLLAEPLELLVLDPVPIGDPAKGAL